MSDVPELPEASNKRLNRAVAATVVILSVTMALSNIKDGNIVQTMQQAQATQVDTWNEYQATRLKLHMEEIAVAQAGSGPDAARAGAALRKYAAESPGLKAQAIAAKADYDHAGYRDDQFDLSDGFASIALATTAIAALVDTWWLLGIGWSAGALSILFSVAGFAELPIHPDALIAFLT